MAESGLACKVIYDEVYAKFVADGYSAAAAGDAAQAAYATCLQRQQTVLQHNIDIPGGRQVDPGPIASAPSNLGKGRKKK